MINRRFHFGLLCSRFLYLATGVVVLGLSPATGSAGAACNLAVSAPRVQMGQMSASTLRLASVPGYRSMGTRSELVSGTCEVSQATFRVEISGLAPIIGKPLVHWGEVGAMLLQIVGASVGGAPVQVKLESAPASPYAQSVDLMHNDVLVLDVSQISPQNRKSLSIQIQVTGLLPESYAVRSEVILYSNVNVQLLSAP